MRLLVFALMATLLTVPSVFAVVQTEAPRNKEVVYKQQYTCTNGEWKTVIRQRTNDNGLNERVVGYKCIREPGKKAKTGE